MISLLVCSGLNSALLLVVLFVIWLLLHRVLSQPLETNDSSIPLPSNVEDSPTILKIIILIGYYCTASQKSKVFTTTEDFQIFAMQSEKYDRLYVTYCPFMC